MEEIRINVDRLAEAVTRELDAYLKSTVLDVEYAVQQTAKKAREELRATSPVDTGEYAKSWSIRKHPDRGRDYNAMVVHAKFPHSSKTHLLERGHRAVDGSFVAARPHIKQVEQKAQRWMYDLLTARLSGRRTR